MEPLTHNMCNLFAQLGLPSDSEAIKQFISTHGRLNSNTLISEAPFWTPTQATFLREEILMDADWVSVIDELNTALHRG
ncbi:MAG: DUF2789 domain-containing protein [Methylophilaceae bacterium]|nr:DUF2789 domain-containing protein [Methylophilaceae bacterium]